MELLDDLQVEGRTFVKGVVLRKTRDRRARGDDSCHDSANSAAGYAESGIKTAPPCENPVEHRVADSASSAQLDELSVDPILVRSPTLLDPGVSLILASDVKVLSLFFCVFLHHHHHHHSTLLVIFPLLIPPRPPCSSSPSSILNFFFVLLCPAGRAERGPYCGEKPYLAALNLHGLFWLQGMYVP
jgi:hypothetical protein